ncbi:signal peptide peptidase-like 2A [Galendromus occidentalis]|uniref:Signal peptide peptidase-like 2A n=1 Tax=Galendromus occidentalis TaxID=34638 RepID=A0AAJ7L685_9ACAR|nr:signal peptide peptidase-like 2A [Galendromus occidentalis]
MNVSSAGLLYTGILKVPSINTTCCLRGYRAAALESTVEIRTVGLWDDFRVSLGGAEEPNRNSSIILLVHVDVDFLLSAAYIHRTLMPKSGGAVVWLPSISSSAKDFSFTKYYYMLAEIVEGSFNASVGQRLPGQVLPNSSTLSHITEIVSVMQAVAVFGTGIYLRYVRARRQIEKHALNRQTSQAKELTREDLLRKLGAWTGVGISYNAGIVLLGLQEICIMLMTVYYFHWISHLLKLAFIVAFITSADILFDDVAEEGGGSFELPKLGSLNYRRTTFRLICVIMAITWFLSRKNPMIWILHNIMASIMCVALIADISLPSMVVICLMAVLLAVYDLFMVFITPRFTADGVSVMESAVLGADGEVMPMVMYTPKFPSLTMYPRCASLRSGFLGLGDIIIPGIVGSYCANFDSMRMQGSCMKTSHLALLAYTLGLMTTYVARELMESAQPALIYITPMMLFILLPAAAMLGIWSNFWNGRLSGEPNVAAKKRG